MDFADSLEHAAFRSEVRGWLETNLPPEICVDDAADQRVAPDRPTLEKRIQWQKTMHAAGWVGISWPKEYGGRGASFMQQVIFDEEYVRARAPVLPGASGLNLLGPSLIHWGSDEQKRRHLRRILNADELWCQGFSEPDAGGDLASLRTRAVDHGDLGRAFRRFVLSIGTDRSRRPQAPWHQLSTGRHEDAGDHGAAAGAVERAPPFQRGVLCRRAGAQGQPRRAAERGLEGRDHDPDVRAQRGRWTRPRSTDRAADRARQAIADAPGAGVEPDPYPPAIGPAGDRGQGLAGDAAARSDAAIARRAAGARRLDPQALRLGARGAHRLLRLDLARPLRDGRCPDRGGARRLALAPPGARRAPIHNRRRH